MAITLLSSGAVGATDSSTSLGFTLSTMSRHDVGIWHTHTNKSTFTHVYPAGWTTPGTILNELASTRTLGISFAYRWFDGTEAGSTVSVKHGGASTAVLMSNIAIWRGVSTNLAVSVPFSTQVSTTANSSIYTTEGVTGDTNSLLVILGSNTDDAAAMATMSSGTNVSTSMTLGYNTESALGNGSIMSMFYSAVTTAGTAQGGVARMGTIEVWSAFEMALDGDQAQAQSILHFTEEFDDAYWTATSSVTADTNDPPSAFGINATDADTINDDSGAAVTGITGTFEDITVDTTDWVCSLFVRKDAISTRFPSFVVQLLGSPSVFAGLSINTATGAIASTGATASGTIDVDTAWWRVWFRVANNGTANAARIFFNPSPTGTLGGSDDSAIMGSVVVWGVNMTNSSVLQAYDPDPSYDFSLGGTSPTNFGLLGVQ